MGLTKAHNWLALDLPHPDQPPSEQGSLILPLPFTSWATLSRWHNVSVCLGLLGGDMPRVPSS